MKASYHIYIILGCAVVLSVGTYFFMRPSKFPVISAQSRDSIIQILPETDTTPLATYKVIKDTALIPLDHSVPSKVILLTIDDGPSKYTADILRTLEKHHAKAIFFINGIHDKQYPTALKAIVDAGMSIGNHTWDHQNLKKITQEQAIDEIKKDTTLIIEKTGSTPRFFRSPYGAGTPFVRSYAKENGMIYMNWSDSTMDWEKSAQDEATFNDNVTKNLHDGDILLMHEHSWTVAFLDKMLSGIEALGYTFVDPAGIVQ